MTHFFYSGRGERLMKQIEECYQILKDPYGYVKQFKAESGRKVVGTFCSYAPEEIILAAGAHPFRLFGSGEKIHLAEAHLQSYCCSLVRGALEDALGGRLAFLDGVVFPHTCDSIQRLSDIWRLNVPACFHLDVVLPVKLDTDGAAQYLIDVLNRFRGELGEKLGGAISDDDLRAAIRTMNRIRAALTRIYSLKGERPEILKGSDLYALVRAAMIMDRTRAASLLEEVAAQIEKESASKVAAWPKSGSSFRAASATTPTFTRSSRRRAARSSGMTSAPVHATSADSLTKRPIRLRRSPGVC
jgi:benzoyl-CoA reductase/2-hydroxyglutaryl-CoA dehydratase subunit BcrC/BadD/HgdB